MTRKDLTFEQLVEIYRRIAEEEKQFNNLELEYRKLASRGHIVYSAIGFVLSIATAWQLLWEF